MGLALKPLSAFDRSQPKPKKPDPPPPKPPSAAAQAPQLPAKPAKPPAPPPVAFKAMAPKPPAVPPQKASAAAATAQAVEPLTLPIAPRIRKGRASQSLWAVGLVAGFGLAAAALTVGDRTPLGPRLANALQNPAHAVAGSFGAGSSGAGTAPKPEVVASAAATAVPRAAHPSHRRRRLERWADRHGSHVRPAAVTRSHRIERPVMEARRSTYGRVFISSRQSEARRADRLAKARRHPRSWRGHVPRRWRTNAA